jgi:hypothetical protein
MKIIPDELAAYRIGDGADLLSLKGVFSTLKMLDGLPVVAMEGITTRIEQAGADFSPRLLFWNGVVSDVPTSSTTQDGLTLRLDGAGGLVAAYWANFVRFWLSTVGVNVQARLSANDLDLFNFHKKKGEYVGFYAQGHHFFVDSVRAELPLNGGISTMRCFLKR